MSYLFHLDQKNNAVLHPEAVKLCPELRLLNEKEVLFIILAFDYNSIYKQYPERQRLSKAIWHVFGDNNPKKLEHLIKGTCQKKIKERKEYKLLLRLINLCSTTGTKN